MVNEKLITKYRPMNTYPFYLPINANARWETNALRSLFSRSTGSYFL